MGGGRAPCCDKSKVKKGPWTPAEDLTLTNFIQNNGHDNWRSLPKQAGLLRCGKSCRLRWINYLRPDVKRGNFTPEEEETIIKLHSSLGNKWSKIASLLPGRTDNEIKNVWNTHLKKKLLLPMSNASKHDTLATGESSVISSSNSDVTSRDQNMEAAGLQLQGDQNPSDEMPPDRKKNNFSTDEEPKEESRSSCFTSSTIKSGAEEEDAGSMLSSMSHGEVDNPMHCPAEDRPGEISDNLVLEIPVPDDESDMDFWSMLGNLESEKSDMDFWSMLGNLESGEDLPLLPQLDDQIAQPKSLNDGEFAIEKDEAEHIKWLRCSENELGLVATADQTTSSAPENNAV